MHKCIFFGAGINMSVPAFYFWKSAFLCYFLVNLCISFSKVRLGLKLPIYRHLRRYLEGVVGGG